MKILIIVGSLRSASFTKKLAEAACALGPEGSEFEIIDGRNLPLYDQDLDGEEKPAAVQTMLDRVSTSDALVFVTPEFNYGIPGPLKNLIDWASRPAFNSPLKDRRGDERPTREDPGRVRYVGRDGVLDCGSPSNSTRCHC